MTDTQDIYHAARRSLASAAAAAGAITLNHLYALGPRALLLGLALVVASAGLLMWFRKTKSTAALVGYLLINLWIVTGFGLYKGLWKGVLPLFLGSGVAAVSTSFPRRTVGPFLFEASGILTFVASLFVAYHSVELTRAVLRQRAGSTVRQSRGRQRRFLPTGALVAAVTVLGAYLLTVRDTWRPPVNGVVTIGVVAPVTGPYAILGTSFVKAVEMARDDLKGTRYRYRLLIEDSGPDPALARDVVRSVVARSDAVIGAVSLIGQITKPYATQARIPHLCVCTVMSIGDGGYNFTNIPPPEAEGARWAQEARRRGIKTVAILAQDYPSINNHVKALKAEAARAGLTITYHAKFADSVTDFRPMIARGQASRPDVYYIEALEPALDLLGQQLRDANVRNIASVVAPSLSERPQLFEGAWYTDSDLADTTFRRRFEAKYPGTPFATHMMPYAYDSFNMIVRAYERRVNPAVYVRRIASYDGAAGTVTKVRGSGNFQSVPAVWVIRDGKPTLLSARNSHTQVARTNP